MSNQLVLDGKKELSSTLIPTNLFHKPIIASNGTTALLIPGLKVSVNHSAISMNGRETKLSGLLVKSLYLMMTMIMMITN